jgi:type IV secretory pathway TrbD component
MAARLRDADARSLQAPEGGPARRPWTKAAILSSLCLAIPCLTALASELLPVMGAAPILASLGSVAPLLLIFGLEFWLVAAIGVIALMIAHRCWRRPGWLVLVSLVSALPLLVATMGLAYPVRIRHPASVPRRAASIISALEIYKRDHGRYPLVLDSLVPDYLPAIPRTGLAGYPRFVLHADRERFELLVPTPMGPKFDMLAYRSTHDYSDFGPPDRIEQLLSGKSRSSAPKRYYLMSQGWALF